MRVSGTTAINSGTQCINNSLNASVFHGCQNASFDDEGLTDDTIIQLTRNRLAKYGGPTKKLRSSD